MYHIVLFVHLFAILLAFFATGLLHAGMAALHRSATVKDARLAAAQVVSASKLHPVSILLLLASGAYMTQVSWTWSTPWIDCSIVALLVIGVFGGGVLGGRERGLQRFLAETPDGAITDAVRQRLHDPLAAVGGPAISFFVFAIMFVMIEKGDWLASIATLVAGAVLGVGVGLVTQPSQTRRAEVPGEA
jgi:hypothetical protein